MGALAWAIARSRRVGELWNPRDPRFNEPGPGGELLRARLRVLAFIVALALAAVGISGSGPSLQGLVVAAGGLFVAVKILFAVVRAYRDWLGVATTALDVSLITAACWLVASEDGPETGLLLALYMLVVVSSAFRYEWRVCLFGGSLAAAQYAAWVFLSGGTLASRMELGSVILLLAAGGLTALLSARAGQFHRLSSVDRLTGLLGQGALDDSLATEIARAKRHSRELMLALVEVDDFDRIAETQGSARAAAILRSVGGTLRRAVRRTDLVARYGGAVFGLVFPETRAESAMPRLAQIRDLVAAESLGGAEATSGAGVSVSVGVAGWPADGAEARELLLATRSRLAEARKGSGVAGPPILEASAEADDERGSYETPSRERS